MSFSGSLGSTTFLAVETLEFLQVHVGPQDTILTVPNHPGQQEGTPRSIVSHYHGILAEQDTIFR